MRCGRMRSGRGDGNQQVEAGVVAALGDIWVVGVNDASSAAGYDLCHQQTRGGSRQAHDEERPARMRVLASTQHMLKVFLLVR